MNLRELAQKQLERFGPRFLGPVFNVAKKVPFVRERIERDQEKLRSEAESELKRISPEIDNLQNGLYLDLETLEPLDRQLLAGRKMLQTDLTDNKNVVILTEYAARKLLAGHGGIGDHVRIGSALFTVAGIIKSHLAQAGGVLVPDRREDAYIPLTTFRQRFGDIIIKSDSGSSIREKVELHQILVEVDQTAKVESTAKAIEYMLKIFHKQMDYQLQVPRTLVRQAEKTKQTFNPSIE